MATTRTRKTATRKPAKKRATRKVATKKVEATPDSVVNVEPQYDPQWHATVEAYVALKNAGAPIPDSIKEPVEKWLVAQEQKERENAAKQAEAAAKRKAADDKGPKWVRNCHNMQFTLRLDRQDKRRKIELKPRGVRGDIFPLEPGDETDHNIITSLGHIEIIGQTEVEEIVSKQTENLQRTHIPLAVLRNERGEAGEQGQGFGLKVEQEWNSQGVVVGVIDKNERGEVNPKDKFGGIRRPDQVAQQFVPTGGNPHIVSSGFQQELSENARASIADDLARRAKGAGVGRPEQALGLSVSIDPVQKT